MPDTPKKFYLTTPIYYVNARPHIGHAYSTIAADVIARRHRLLGDDTFFLTGTDEHGQKVQRSAEKAGIAPQQFANEVSATFRDLWARMGITNDDYIRTTDQRHKKGVQKLWRDLEARGAIYLSSYTGQYCVSEEMFVDGPPGTIGPDGNPTETITEENYFFRLSEYQLPLINLIESGQLHIQPETVRNEVLSFLRGSAPSKNEPVILSEGGAAAESKDLRLSAAGTPYVPGALKDLSISRTSFTWGIPVPESISGAEPHGQASYPEREGQASYPEPEGHAFRRADKSRAAGVSALPKAVLPNAAPNSPQSHVIYVWLDALANYITAIGYGSDDPHDQAKFAKYWPADLHLVGKEITRFHCVYWPAFLMALRPPEVPEAEWNAKWIPKSVVANGWLLFEESKMSKSRGNVVRTETILDAFGPLCPPLPASSTSDAARKGTPSGVPPSAPPLEVVILSEAKDSCISPEPLPASDLLSSRSAAGGSASPAQLQPPTKGQQDLFASDVIRYFLLREIPFGQDGTFSFDALITRYNADLANGYGNLVSRVLTMIGNSSSGIVPNPPKQSLIEEVFGEALTMGTGSLVAHIREAKGAYTDFLNGYHFGAAISAPISIVAYTDRYISDQKPWKLAKSDHLDDRKRLEEVLYTAAESIRIITALLYPILPYATASVWAQLGLGSIEEAARKGELKNLQWGGLKPGTRLGPLTPIFPRADKGLAQIMTDMESPTPNASPSPEPALSPAPAQEKSAQSVSSVLSSSPEAPLTPEIAIDDFIKIDLRVAQIVVAERIPKADKLLRLEVDLGPAFGRRQILSGIAEWYTPEELIGRRIAVIANLAPRKMRGLESHGMLLAASGDDHSSKPILATFSDQIPVGSRIR